MNSMQRQKDRTRKDELPRSVGAQYTTGDQWRNNSRKNEGMEPKQKEYPEYTEELYKKDLHDPDNHDGMITHLEPDILEREVKWALGSITMNKASGGDGIPVELF